MFCIQTDLTCFIILLLIFIAVRKNEDNKDRITYFKALLLFTMCSCIFDLLIFIFDSSNHLFIISNSILNNVMLKVSCLAFFISTGIAVMFGMFYLAASSGVILKKWFYYVGAIPEAIIVILSLISLFVNAFYTTENNVYGRGQIYYLDVILMLSYFFIGIVFCLYSMKNKLCREDRTMEIVRIGIVLLPIIGLCFQIHFYGTFLVIPCSTLALLLVYFFKNHHDLNFDGLTNVYQKKVFERTTSHILMHYKKTALIIVDIDHFKEINDTYGHKQGDVFLKFTADKLKQFFPANSLVGRIGGDEFSVILYGYENIKSIEDKCSLFLDSVNSIYKDIADIDYSCSMGIVECEKNTLYQDAYQKADKALYNAKRNGKNTCRLYNHNLVVEGLHSTILIVDEAEINRVILSSYLEDKCNVIEAITGEEALRFLKEYKDQIALVLLDLDLPDITFIDFIRTIRQEQLIDPERIVIETSKPLNSSELKMFGLTSILKMPFNLESIEKILEKMNIVK